MIIISIANVKGGVCKSTTALFLGTALSQKYKILLIDKDPQNALTSYFTPDYTDIAGHTIYEALLGHIPIEDTILKLNDGLHFIPADTALHNLAKQLPDNSDFKLLNLIQPLEYDYIVIDTPPNLNLETRLALVSSNYIIIPTILEKWATRTIDIVLDYIQGTNQSLQKIAKIDFQNIFILPVMFEKNRKLQSIILEDLKKIYKDKILTPISRRTDVQKAIYLGTDVPLEPLLAFKEYKTIVKALKTP